MTRKVLYIGAAVAALIGLLSWGIGYAHRSPERRMGWIAKRLDLNEQQTAKLQAVYEAMRQAREQFHKERAALFDEIVAQIQSEHLDEAKVLHLFEQRQALMSQFAPQVVAKIADFHASLTPEQKVKAVEYLERFKERMENRDYHSHH